MWHYRAENGHVKTEADVGYAQVDKSYVRLCPEDRSVMKEVRIRIETIDDSTQNYSVYKCPKCERYLAEGGKLLKDNDKRAAAKTINDMRKGMGRPLEEPYTASEIVLVEEY